MKIMIGNAWPFANGGMHIGHIAALLPGDVLARYHRQKGDDVYFVSGSDCHGTPIMLKARAEGKSPYEISGFYHREFVGCFNRMGFTYDRYGETSSEEHINFVVDFHRTMYESGYVYEKTAPQAYCNNCGDFLADRYVVGLCPDCGSSAKGDQCDACGKVLEPETMKDPKCAVCGDTPVFRDTTHLYIAISKMERKLLEMIEARPHWRKNATAFSKRYIDEGLRDRAVTRDMKWGIPAPKEGYEGKTIYVWMENVLGYLSMSYAVANERGESFTELWGEGARHYYVHGKDNIPFHSIILPALLMANGDASGTDWHMPDEMVSSEFMTLEGKKISTSNNWAVWLTDIVDRYDPDSLRYFFISNGPERRDTDFSWREYVNSHNGELLGAYGNFVNRTLAFIYKYFDGIIPGGALDNGLNKRIGELYPETGALIEGCRFKEALDTIFEFVRAGNKYFDTQEPWLTRTGDVSSCHTTLFNCVQMIANLSILLEPFLPFSSAKVMKWLGIEHGGRAPVYIPAGLVIPAPEILFTRLDKKIVAEETAAIGK